VFTTSAGWTMILVGVGVGFLFALLVLAISVVSFPLLLDRDVGLDAAVWTSIRAVAANPGPMALWGLIVAAGLVIGSIPVFLGLIIVMPVLGHATWHLYARWCRESTCASLAWRQQRAIGQCPDPVTSGRVYVPPSWPAKGQCVDGSGWQVKTSRRSIGRCSQCVRPVSAVRMTVGHNALRG